MFIAQSKKGSLWLNAAILFAVVFIAVAAVGAFTEFIPNGTGYRPKLKLKK